MLKSSRACCRLFGSLVRRGYTAIDAPRDRPERAPAGQHEQRQQRTTFMPAQLSVKSPAVVNHGGRVLPNSFTGVR
jgi:hypothetical protein